MGMYLTPKRTKIKRKDVVVKKKQKTYELIDPMTIRWVRTTLVIADDISTDPLGVVVVGVQACNDHTPLCALGRQARRRARFW
jgi:hypothetical protein